MKRLFLNFMNIIIKFLKFTLSQVVARCVSRDHNRKVEPEAELNTNKL